MRYVLPLLASGCFLLPAPTPEPTDVPEPTEPPVTEPPEEPTLYVFVTTAVYPGDLARPGESAGGIERGDALCDEAAGWAGLPGRYVAWLSDGTRDAIDALPDDGPWVDTNDREVFPDREAIRSSGPARALQYDELGDYLDPASVWTGTRSDGTADPLNCGGWTSQQGRGMAGSGRGTPWTEQGPEDCYLEKSLLCFQVE